MTAVASPSAIAAMLGRGEPTSVLLDYDGTLVPFAPRPEMACPDGELIDLLRALARVPSLRVEIVSGRDRDTLGDWLADVPITLRAEHGMWLRRRGDREWTAQFHLTPGLVDQATAMVESVALAHGGLVERKRSGAAWHYRGLDVLESEVRGVISRLEREARPRGLEVLRGACVVELRMRGVHKGNAVSRVRKNRPRARILALGDDVTDEDMFRRLRAADVGVLVGSVERETRAHVRVSDVSAARALLAAIVG